MSNDRVFDYLEHLRHEALEAMKFVEGKDSGVLSEDSLVQHGVVMCLINIGEAATRIMDRHAAFAEAHPEIPWREIRRMRNKVAHGYLAIDFDIVWDVVKRELPALLERLPSPPDHDPSA